MIAINIIRNFANLFLEFGRTFIYFLFSFSLQDLLVLLTHLATHQPHQEQISVLAE